MLSAKCEPLGGMIYAPAWVDRWSEIEMQKGFIECPFTGQLMSAKKKHVSKGHTVTAHFAHYGQRKPLDDNYLFDDEIMEKEDGQTFLRGESWQHLLGKIIAGQEAPELFGINPEAKLCYEHRFTLANGKWRIADVAFILPGGFDRVIEIQLANITTEQLEERTSDYESIGVEVDWWIGGRAVSQKNSDWQYERFAPPLLRLSGFDRQSYTTN